MQRLPRMLKSMRFGLNLPLTGIFSDIALAARLAREAEASGWDGCFVWDHLSIAGAARLADPWLALALIAQATKQNPSGSAGYAALPPSRR